MPTERTPGTSQGPVVGVLATITGLAAGHLIAGLVSPVSSPAVAVAGRMIDLAPTPVKEWAVSTLGTNDKPVLVGGVIVVVLALGALIGALAVRRTWLVWAGPAVLSLIAAVAAVTAPSSGSLALLPAAVTFGVGTAVLWWLLPRRPVDEPQGAPRALPRRAFLTGTAAAGVGSAAAVIGGQWFANRTTAATDVVLPRAGETLAPLSEGLSVDGLSPWTTPNADFYRVDISLLVPSVSVDDWRLSIDGLVDHPFSLTWQELTALPLIERDVTLNCVSNEVGGPYIGGARWLGVRTRDLLERAGVQAGADQVLSRSTDGFTVSTPIQALTDDRDALVAIGMNGRPLPAEHGFPARLITPGLYGYVGATKWLTQLTLTTYAQQASYWTQRGWAEQGPVKPSSRIDVPRPLARIQPGEVIVAGVAWAQHIGVARVQVRIDGGEWREATMGPDAGIDFWRQWKYVWQADSGQHTLECRVIDDNGSPQTEQRATPFPDGASGLQSVVLNVD
ncbi:molybdopterin-dependent oxidoreductase [Micropruina sonneratiae]|uniref:molybdopterin-dependent oxidoreductase n=1 Tax=Micropruina sonneratiae TaxID=2986940 RepID=UPI00222649FE|nr:molybdopterin-dependent oxidoreductase [Micropruina sp. KQZ13P-5]MCW3158855.1 molybdopterin-dependent oxidoreductase [Micropruina sp. KQZ13P-5]